MARRVAISAVDTPVSRVPIIRPMRSMTNGVLLAVLVWTLPACSKDGGTLDDGGVDASADEDGGGIDTDAGNVVGDPDLAAPSGMALLKDINVRTAAVHAHDYTTLGAVTLFIVDDASGQRLYRTDGTAAGTTLVTSFAAASSKSAAIDLSQSTVLDGKLYFTANDGTHGSEPWRTDGTAAGTERLAATPGGLSVYSATEYFAALGKLFLVGYGGGFSDRKHLCTDGTSAGTIDLGVGNYADWVELNGKVIYTASSPSFDIEPWITDGTAAGTHMLKHVGPGTSGSSANSYRKVGSRVYFWASDGTVGMEPWVTDGTEAGTMLLKDINPGQFGESAPPKLEMVPVGGLALFTANDGAHGTELWATDGTTAGTVLVKDINNVGSGSSTPHQFVTLGGVAYFFAYSPSGGNELWRSDGTAAGTTQVKDIDPGSMSGISVSNLVVLNDALYFVATDGTTQSGLWRSDGTEAGTTMVVDPFPGSDAHVTELVSSAGKLFFSAVNMTSDGVPYVSDGSAAGTRPLADLSGGRTSDSIPDPGTSYLGNALAAQLGDKTLFVADDYDSGSEPWITDGTPAGTRRLADINPGAKGSMWSSRQAARPVVLAGQFLFAANDGMHGFELWISDGTEAGTHLVKDVNPGAATGVVAGLSPGILSVIGDVAYFVGIDASGAELWKTDGTEAGTQQVIDLNPMGSGIPVLGVNDKPGHICSFGTGVVLQGNDGMGTAVFAIQGGVATRLSAYGTSMSECVSTAMGLYFISPGKGLFKSDGTLAGTVQLLNNPATSESSGLMAVGDKVAFAGPGANNYRFLWASDGTAAGTVPMGMTIVRTLLADESPTYGASGPGSLQLGVALQGKLYFSGATMMGPDGSSGQLWSSDLTAAGTAPLTGAGDVVVGGPRNFLFAGTSFFFAANDGVHGFELWQSDGTQAGTMLVGDLNPGAASAIPIPLGMNGNKLVFAGSNGLTGMEPWVYTRP